MADAIRAVFKIKEETSFSNPERQSPGILDDFPVRKHLDTYSGTIQKVPSSTKDIANKAYVDSVATGDMTKAVYDASLVAEQLAGLTASQTLSNKTLTKPVISGTPSSAGQIGRNTGQLMLSYYDNGMLGIVSRTIAVGVPAESVLNTAAADIDFTSIFVIPANYLVANKVLRITIGWQQISGISSVTLIPYLKLGSTKVFAAGVARNYADSITRSAVGTYYIHGTAAAGASVNVETCALTLGMALDGNSGMNSVAQPVALATNASLSVVPGVTWSSSGSTDTLTLRTYLVEEVN